MAPLEIDVQPVNGSHRPGEDYITPSSPIGTTPVTGGAGFM